MEWATEWHGVFGRVLADKRSVEYVGQGNHSTDAACFVGSESVGSVHRQRTLAGNAVKTTQESCLTSPFDADSTRKPRSDSRDSNGKRDSVNARGDGVVSASKTAKKTTPPRKKHRKKRRLTSESSDLAEVAAVHIPVYYYEVVVMATKHFQGDDGHVVPLWASDDASDEVMDDEDGEGSDMVDVEEDHDGEEDGQHLVDDTPWRSRVRRLVHSHLRATSEDGVVRDLPSRRESSTSASQPPRPNGNGSRSASPPTTALPAPTTAASTSSSSPTQQQLLLSFPLSTSTIQQIRLRLERQHQQTQSFRRQLNTRGSLTLPSSMTLSSAISSIHARQRRESAQRKRSNHRISIGFQLTSSHVPTINGGCEELGRQARSIALVGKNGSIQSNGRVFQQTDTTFGIGDTVGCGVILDSRTFFWTVNGRIIATLAATDIHHLDDLDDHTDDDEGGDDWITAWANHVRPAVSLHEYGECVRATFVETDTDQFQFDLEQYVNQQATERQKALAVSPFRRMDEEESMFQLVEDYFIHYGYGSSLAALRQLHQSSHRQTAEETDSLSARHRVRRLVYSFKTAEALQVLEAAVDDLDPVLRLHCRLLSVVDVLFESKTDDMWDVATAVATASDRLATYLIPVGDAATSDESMALLTHVKAFMSALLYKSVSAIPSSCPGRKFLLWSFREQVADEVNNVMLARGTDTAPQASALETLLDDLSELQRDCLNCGGRTFPTQSNELGSDWFGGRKRHHSSSQKRRQRRRQSRGMSIDDDSEQESDDSESGSSHSESSGSDSGDGDENDDEDDDEDDDEA